MKTKTTLFLEKLKTIPKSYFSFRDLTKFYPGKKKNLRIVVHRLVKQKKLIRLLKGYYTFDLTQIDWEQFACELVQPSYISLEYALHQYGIIDQVPARITLITTKKTREFRLPNQVLEYSHINSKLYFGYKIQGNFLLAEKEKALLDELYLISLKKRHLSLENLDLVKINKKLFHQWLKKFPFYMQKLAKKLNL
jgi:predicted transcriptional regulator of viral defense system